MKSKIYLSIAALLLVLASVLLVFKARTPRLTLEDGAYRTSRSVAYLEAPSLYRASSILNNEAVYLAKGGVPDSFPLYAIENANSKQWLADENYTLFYNESTKLPTLAEMNPYAISLCWMVNGTAQERARLDQTHSEQVDELVRLLTEGPSYPKGTLLLTEHDSVELLFHSEEYPEFYYVLQYWKFKTPFVYSDGEQTVTIETGVVYDRYNGRFYPIGDVLETYFINS